MAYINESVLIYFKNGITNPEFEIFDISMTEESTAVYGNCEGPNAKYLKLISSDGFEFIVDRDKALNASPTLRNMLTGPGEFQEGQTNEITLKDIPSHVLANVCRYFNYKAHFTDAKMEIPDFPIDVEVVVELLIAADFLDC